MKRNELFHSVLFWILRPESILYLFLDPKNFDLGIPNPKSKLFVKKLQLISLWSILFWVLVTAVFHTQ